MLAMIAPIWCYNIIFAVCKARGIETFSYFYSVPWLIMLGSTLVWPVAHLYLMVFFEPIMALIRSKLWIDPSKTTKRGAFAPIDHED